MFKKLKTFKNLLRGNNDLLRTNNKLLKELEWANVYHDSIRGKVAIETLSLNIGRWAGNYTFFYILNRILSDYKPKNIIEFGLGESSKFISTFIENYSEKSRHLIIEQSQEWKDGFLKKFHLSKTSEIKVLEMIDKEVNSFNTNGYEGIESISQEKFDLYIVDGPFGSPNYSRYDIVTLAKSFSQEDEFIIVIDDYQRRGEQETAAALIKVLEKKHIKNYKYVYSGGKSLMVIATEKYKYITSI